MKDNKVFDFEKLCKMISNISFIFTIIFVSIQLLFYILRFTGLLEIIFPVGTDKIFASVIYCYGLGTFLFLLLFPFWIIFNIILEIIRVFKLKNKKEKINYLNIIKIVISLILSGVVYWFFFANIFV